MVINVILATWASDTMAPVVLVYFEWLSQLLEACGEGNTTHVVSIETGTWYKTSLPTSNTSDRLEFRERERERGFIIKKSELHPSIW